MAGAPPPTFENYSPQVNKPAKVKERTGEAEADVAEATKPATIREAGAKAVSAEAKAELDRLKLAQAQAADEAAKEGKKTSGQKRVADLENLLYNVNQARQNIGFWSMGAPGQLTQGLWSSPSRDLSSALEGVLSPIVIKALETAKAQSKTGASGFGALTERELDLLKASIASLKQSQSRKQLEDNLNRVEYHFRRFQTFNAGIDADSPEGQYYAGLTPPEKAKTTTRPAGSKETPVAGEEVVDPEASAINATIAGMIRAGRTEDQIRAWANEVQPGLGDKLTGVKENVEAFKASVGKKTIFEPVVDVGGKLKPREGLGKIVAEGVLTTRPGAVATGFADAYTSGLMDEFTGGARSRATMARVQEENPFLYGTGQLGGSIAQYATGAKLLGPLFSKYYTPMAADALQSALYGIGSAEGDVGDRLLGGVTGGVTGVGGGVVARRASDLTDAMLRGSPNARAELLAKYDVPMTTGQITGGGMRDFEDLLLKVPYVGSQVAARRGESLEGFNRAAFNEAVAPLGAKVDAIGPEGVQAAQDLVEGAYTKALQGAQIVVDQPLVQVLRGAPYNRLSKIPRVGPELQAQVDEIVNSFVDTSSGTPVLSGDNLQAAWRSLRNLRQSYKTDPQFGQTIAPVLNQFEDAFTDAMSRQLPDRADLFKNANEAYKRTSIIGDAVDFAGEVFTPTQLNVRSRQVARTFGGKAASRRGDRPFFDLIRAGRSTIPAQGQEAGSAASQLLVPATLAAGAGGVQYGAQSAKEGEEADLAEPATTTALLAALLAGPYSRAGQKIVQQTLLTPRPAALKKTGDVVAGVMGRASKGVGPLAVDYTLDRVPQPEVPYRPDYTPSASGLSTMPAAGDTAPQEPQGGYYDAATDTYVLSSGLRVRPDGTIVEE